MKKAKPRSLMEFHEPRMATTESNVVSRIRSSEMPSTPRWYEMPRLAIQLAFSWNW